MYTVTKSISFCYGHRLLNHKGRCRHLHGHNADAIVTLASETLDALGMVTDFHDIGEDVKKWIDEEIDHTMLLHADDPFLPAMQSAGERVYVMQDNPTAENIARLIFDKVQSMGYPVVEVTIAETDTASASYQP